MDRDELLDNGRAFAESGMRDECVIRRRTGTTTDQETGKVTVAVTVLYTGKCRFQQANVEPNQSNVAEDQVLLQRMEVQVPMEAKGFEVDDEVECLTSWRDPDLPGRRFRVRGLAHKSEATARRLQLRERTD